MSRKRRSVASLGRERWGGWATHPPLDLSEAVASQKVGAARAVIIGDDAESFTPWAGFVSEQRRRQASADDASPTFAPCGTSEVEVVFLQRVHRGSDAQTWIMTTTDRAAPVPCYGVATGTALRFVAPGRRVRARVVTPSVPLVCVQQALGEPLDRNAALALAFAAIRQMAVRACDDSPVVRRMALL
jgi:hypothetical protein